MILVAFSTRLLGRSDLHLPRISQIFVQTFQEFGAVECIDDVASDARAMRRSLFLLQEQPTILDTADGAH